MSHCKVLMIGTPDNLDQIYADCQDSSSETEAEMTFGYDYCEPYNMLTHKSIWDIKNENECIFTKNSQVFKEYVLNGCFYDVWDIRDNTTNHLIFSYGKDSKKAIEYIKSLPDNITMFYCDAHL